ncbi:MAG: polysaccharide biosynthesis protein CapD [Solirubrobacterales bacterium]|jgi:FlaA1/EpsC-like NDP-sugar epimerase|nr:polysaccharide biosynthesis protein CapD [Solirubrobacterales bacterium]
MSRVTDPVYRRRALEFVADALLCAAAFALAFILRFLDEGGNIPERYETMLVGSIAFVAIGKALVLDLLGMHQQWWRYFRLPDLWPLVRSLAIASVLLLLVYVLAKPYPDSLPRSVLILDFILSCALLGGARLARRTLAERPSRQARDGRARELLVVGAGSGGQMVVRELKLNPNLGAQAIGFLDDDPRKRGMRTEGLKVLGTTDEIGPICDRLAPDEVVIAIPSAPGVLRAKVVAECRDRDIQVRTLPTVFELLRGGVQLTRQLREVQVEDVLGRDPVVMELERVGAYLEDKRVMVTGAGGSIGSELCRQIARVRPRLLMMLDHAEDNLFEIDREMTGRWHFTRVESVLADCKEGDRMLEVMQRFKPEVVFHAAAYKHVPLMEANPLEALRNNAIATQVTAKTAAATGTQRFVLVSTDKAVNPRTVMGATKAMAEWIVEAAGQRTPRTKFTIVRFGNVLASSGSVVPIFRSQIEHGGPVTVTHPEMTRYFMTIPESVQLVIQAGDLGGASGEVFVLEMGEPVRIIDLARNMIRLAGYEPDADIAIEIVGVRPGEKIHEELLNRDERPRPTTAERIVRAVRAAPLDPEWVEETVQRLESLVAAGDEAGLAEHVVELTGAEGSARRTLA